MQIKSGYIFTGVFLLAGILKIQLGMAQDFDKEFSSFLKQIGGEFAETQEQYEQEHQGFIDSLNAVYSELLQSYDKQFAVFLDENWIQHSLMNPFQNDSAPRPDELPDYDPGSGSGKQIRSSLKQISGQSVPKVIVLPYSDSISIDAETACFDYFGTKVSFLYDPGLKTLLTGDINHTSISRQWVALCKTHYGQLLHQIQAAGNRFQVNDWGYYQLIRKFSENLHPDDQNHAVLLSWFLMLKSSYEVRIGYGGNQIILLMPVIQKVYGMPSLQIQGTTYYALDYSGSSLTTYRGDYAGAASPVDLSVRLPLNLKNNVATRTIRWSYNEAYTIDLNYDETYRDFFSTYPVTELQVYLDAPFSESARESVIEEIMPLMIDFSEEQQIAFLLRMVQEGFSYGSDQSQFGKEKVFTGDEMLAYPYSDCEDRAVFFAKLVSELLGKEVVLLDFPGHVAAGVQVVKEHTDGNCIGYNGINYLICDPSYMNAPPGAVLPEYSAKPATIITQGMTGIKNIANGQEISEDISNSETFPNALLLYSGNSIYAARTSSGQNIEEVELCKYDADSNLIWCRRIETESHFIPLALDLDAHKNLFIAGTTEGKTDPDYMVVKISPEGNIMWQTLIPAGDLVGSEDLYFQAIISKEGKLSYLSAMQHPECREDFLFHSNSQGESFLQALLIRQRLEGPVYMDNSRTGNYDIVSDFLKRYENAEATTSDTLSAFCLTLFSFLGREGVVIRGDQLESFIDGIGDKNIIDQLVPGEQLEKVASVRNYGGTIELHTRDGSSVVLGDITIEDQARCRVVYLHDRLKIMMIHGFYKGNLYHKDAINYLDIMKSGDQMFIDYSNHYNKKLVMKADLM